ESGRHGVDVAVGLCLRLRRIGRVAWLLDDLLACEPGVQTGVHTAGAVDHRADVAHEVLDFAAGPMESAPVESDRRVAAACGGIVGVRVASDPTAAFASHHEVALRGRGAGTGEPDLVVANEPHAVTPVGERAHAVARARCERAIGHRVADTAQDCVLEGGGQGEPWLASVDWRAWLELAVPLQAGGSVR